MAKKHYVVWVGRNPGVYADWPTAHKQVDKFAGAKFKSFPTLQLAQEAFTRGVNAESYARKPPVAKAVKLEAPLEQAYDVAIYCDGACEPNPGQAGSGVAVYRGGVLCELWYGLYESQGTNNTAELHALHQALLMAEHAVVKKHTVIVLSDSQYSLNCITNWASGWERKGWKKSGGEIKNLVLIQNIYHLYQRIKASIELQHVKAHVGYEGNELADRMSVLAVEHKMVEFSPFKPPYDVASLLSMRRG